MKKPSKNFLTSSGILFCFAYAGVVVGGASRELDKSNLETAQWEYKEAVANEEYASDALDDYRLTLPEECLRTLGRYTFGGEFEQLPAVEAEKRLKLECGSIDITTARDHTNAALVAIAQKDRANSALINAKHDNASSGVEALAWFSISFILGAITVIVRNRTRR